MSDELEGDMTEATGQQLVYGEVDGGLVFVAEDQANSLRSLWAALHTADTWGELQGQIDETSWKEIVAAVTDGGEEPEPQPDAPFDPVDIPGFEDGDWPDWLAQGMLDWMPPGVVEGLGSVEASMVSGEMLFLEGNREDEVVMALERHGYSVRKDEELVRAASGRD